MFTVPPVELRHRSINITFFFFFFQLIDYKCFSNVVMALLLSLLIHRGCRFTKTYTSVALKHLQPHERSQFQTCFTANTKCTTKQRLLKSIALILWGMPLLCIVLSWLKIVGGFPVSCWLAIGRIAWGCGVAKVHSAVARNQRDWGLFTLKILLYLDDNIHYQTNVWTLSDAMLYSSSLVLWTL